MMPDRYDDLKKRLATKQVIEYTNPDLNMEPLDLEGQEPIEPYNPNPSYPTQSQRSPNSDAGFLPDLAASAGPGLLALFGGASPRVTNDLLQKGDAYARGRGKQEEITKDKISVIDNDGQPENILTRDSVGKQPFYPKKGVGGIAGQGGVGKFIPGRARIQGVVKDILTNNVTGETRDRYTGEVYDQGQPFLTPQYKSSRSLGGGYNVTEIDPLTGQSKERQLDPGVGEAFGGVSREEAQSGIKSAEKGKDKSFKALEAVQGAKRALSILEKPDLSPEQAAQGIFYVVKATNGERLSDTDYANLRGEEFKSYARQFEDWANGRVGGNVSPKAVRAFKEIAADMIRGKEAEARAIKRLYVPEKMLPQKGQKKVETVMGGADAPKVDRMQELKDEILKKLQTKKFR